MARDFEPATVKELTDQEAAELEQDIKKDKTKSKLIDFLGCRGEFLVPSRWRHCWEYNFWLNQNKLFSVFTKSTLVKSRIVRLPNQIDR